ncbi:TonB-dependent receptor [Sanyastnella coralliicola]|uniref:TonB-dependent receptor n=1 Tax=Sanyastnella coralliicola TaxID=3069118 RepID=UPI0027B99FAA|nr:TonB-dependent receptor [Longitalea sp. SCSIO 12813]
MKHLIVIVALLLANSLFAQKGQIHGSIQSQGEPLPFAGVLWSTSSSGQQGLQTDAEGNFSIFDLPVDSIYLEFHSLGYKTKKRVVYIPSSESHVHLTETLEVDVIEFDQVVVTGTRTNKRQTETPVIVNIIDDIQLENVGACNLSDGLIFQPGLRVETDCQTCNYTQLRMNGLAGGYSQILINGRPIFSPLTSLYGMEQLPANMIERIEIVRGGGSALYGSSAIGGTVNVITKVPSANTFDISTRYSSINGEANDVMTMANGTILSNSGKSGVALYLNHRQREWYDHNGDNYSELPSLDLNAFGGSYFFLPTTNQKLEINFSSMVEQRYGGEMVDGPAHLAQQAEDRTHNVLMGNIDYQINSKDYNSSLIAYVAGQRTDRDHYTGILPDDEDELTAFLLNPPYGTSLTTTMQGGLQLNHRFRSFPLGENVITVGGEYLLDDVDDRIPSYNYLIDQQTKNFGAFVQSDWKVGEKVNLLAGARIDEHNLVDRAIISPRVSLMYTPKRYTQLRFAWGRGFRAPQAFDTDLHIAFAGGGISRVNLAPTLIEERSNSFTASFNYDRPRMNSIVGITLEAFYTELDDAFFLAPLGFDDFGARFEKQNGDGAIVQGITVEGRANYDGKVQAEVGFTLQQSEFDNPVDVIEGLEPTARFLRTPDAYGYGTFTFTPSNKWKTTVNLVHTGSMLIAHFAGAPEQEEDAYETSEVFTEIGIRSSYLFRVSESSGLEIFGGVRNITNAYQNDFDTGKNRDSNYVYGPAMPRTIFAGIRLRSL